jgi:hypothetical protein
VTLFSIRFTRSTLFTIITCATTITRKELVPFYAQKFIYHVSYLPFYQRAITGVCSFFLFLKQSTADLPPLHRKKLLTSAFPASLCEKNRSCKIRNQNVRHYDIPLHDQLSLFLSNISMLSFSRQNAAPSAILT